MEIVFDSSDELWGANHSNVNNRPKESGQKPNYGHLENIASISSADQNINIFELFSKHLPK